MCKAVKFGGSSLADAGQFRKVKEIICADASRRYVVPSAPGKRFAEDVKVTDMLYACYALAEEGKDFHAQLQAIERRYLEIVQELQLTINMAKEFRLISEKFREKAGSDYAASRGEYLNGIIMAAYLDYEFIDAADVIFFNEKGQFDLEQTDRILSARLAHTEHAVIPGFYGVMPDGTIKTFSRGGSDITGAIVARAVGATVYENWTDVSGFMIADPRVVKNPKVIDTITYRELRELSYMGASVLHEDAVFPIRKQGIPINIRNTNAPEEKGTWIVEIAEERPQTEITGISGKKGFCSVNIEKHKMNAEIGFGRKVLQVFENNGISFEHVPTGIDTLTVYVHQDAFVHKERKVVEELRRLAHPDAVETEWNLALIAVVGRKLRSARGIAGKIFSALAQSDVNVKMIDQGSSEITFTIGVKEEDFETAIRAIYAVFCEP